MKCWYQKIMIDHLDCKVIDVDNYRVYITNNFFDTNVYTTTQLYLLLVEEFFKWKEKKLEGFVNKGSYNFLVTHLDPNYFDSLYYKFVYFCLKHFGPFTLNKNNKNSVWAYLNNKNNFESEIHNHSKTAVINGVYYFNTPSEIGSKLNFYNDNRELIFEHLPTTNQLLVFDGNLNHMPTKSHTEQFRIALNMEIVCSNEPLNYLRN